MAKLDEERASAVERPLAGYATLSGAFWGVFALFVWAARRRLPERLSYGDLGRIALATYKLSRVISKDPVTAFVRAPVTEDAEASEPKKEGLERVLGELVTCPYCLGVWISSGLVYAHVLSPRPARLATAIFGAQALADFLNAGFVRAQRD